MIIRPIRRLFTASGRLPGAAIVAAALVFALVFALLAAAPALAQATTPPAAGDAGAEARLPSAAELEALAATLSDESKRKELLSTLQGLIEARKHAEAQKPQTLSERLVTAAETSAASGKAMIDEIMTEIGGVPGAADWFQRLAEDGQARARLLRQLGFFAIILAAAWIAELLVWRLLAGPRRRLSRPVNADLARRTPLLLGLAILDLIPLLGFSAGGYAAFVFVRPGLQLGPLALQFLIVYVTARALLALARLVFAPNRPEVRVLPAGDETANYLYVWARRFINVGAFGYFAIEALLSLGLPQRANDGLIHLLGALLALLAIVFILQNRSTVAQWLRGDDPAASGRWTVAPLRRGIAAVWHLAAAAYVVGVFAVWAWEIENGFDFLIRATVLSAIVFAIAIALMAALRRVRDHGFGVTDDQSLRYPLLKERANRYLPYIYGTLRIVVVIAAALAILFVWGIDIVGWMSDPLGSRIIGGAVSIAVVVAIAVVVWELANVAIERRLEAAADESADAVRAARLRTLLPLMRKALLAVLSVMVFLIVLAELGVNIGPLLAGAGIVGLAFGFGAQTLVKDIITGAFMLIEDALAVGDVVTVAGIGGLVEDMSIRSIRLRDLSGNVHTIPFSSVDTVTNMTKEFSYYLLDIAVAYREDTDEVARVCCEIVEEMRGEDAFAPLILEPLEVLGVDQFADSAVILKARIKTRPIKQWVVGREFNRRMKKRFDALGIEIPFPHRTLYFGVDKDGGAPAAHLRVEGHLHAPASTPTPAAATAQPTTADAESGTGARKTHVAVDLPDPHPDTGPRGEDAGEDDEAVVDDGNAR